jgi:hypothetical protein
MTGRIAVPVAKGADRQAIVEEDASCAGTSWEIQTTGSAKILNINEILD